MKNYPEDRRTIVSFLLSTLLNNISKKKDGFILFNKKGTGKAMLLIDLAFYAYAYYPSFDQTRKVISIITYINSELNFKSNQQIKIKLQSTIRRYSFIFLTKNIFDLCDWFPFFHEYQISLDTNTETHILEVALETSDPIVLANILIYSRYHIPFFKKTRNSILSIIEKKILCLSKNCEMEQPEFWHILIFHNCPYISHKLKADIKTKISNIKNNIIKSTSSYSSMKPNSVQINPSNESKLLICSFLENSILDENKTSKGLFNWNGIKNFGAQLTYRTYQRTVFKNYNKNVYSQYASIP